MRDIKIGENVYKIHYGQNAICALEDELNESISDFYTRLNKNKIRYKDIRAIIWAGMLKENQDLKPSDICDLCDNANISMTSILEPCIQEMNDSFARIIPDKKEEKDTPKKN